MQKKRVPDLDDHRKSDSDRDQKEANCRFEKNIESKSPNHENKHWKDCVFNSKSTENLPLFHHQTDNHDASWEGDEDQWRFLRSVGQAIGEDFFNFFLRQISIRSDRRSVSVKHAFSVASREENVKREARGENKQKKKAHFQKLGRNILKNWKNTRLRFFFFRLFFYRKQVQNCANQKNSDGNEENIELKDAVAAYRQDGA